MIRSRLLGIAGATILALGMASRALAQGWLFECIDPANTEPYSPDYGTIGVESALFAVDMGVSGTATWGNTDDTNGIECYREARTYNAAGRFAFGIGQVGSVQSDFDDNLALTTGFDPFGSDPIGSYCYAMIDKGINADGSANRNFFGNGGLRGFFRGASNRYFVGIWGDNDVDVELTVRVIGDAGRFEWKMTNRANEPRTLGLRFGAYVGMRTSPSSKTDSTGANQANSFLNTISGIPKFVDRYVGWTVLPTTKPARNSRNYLRTNPKFPNWVNFNFGQTDAYGMRVENTNNTLRDQTNVDQFIIDGFGDNRGPGLLRGNEGGDENFMRNRIFGDNGRGDPLLDATADPALEENDVILTETSFVQVFRPQSVAALGTRTIVSYYRSVWSNGDYADPYTALVDAPRLIASSPGDFNDLAPNPFEIVAYVDNQFARLDKEVALNDVRFTITLSPGLELAPGEVRQKLITRIGPNQIDSVRWDVEATGEVFGTIPYTVKVEPIPGPSKIITGSVLVSATPQLRLGEGPNLISIPWSFPDTSFDQVLGLSSTTDYSAFGYEPGSNGYVSAVSVERGRGYWVIGKSDLGFVQLQSAQAPTDTGSGGLIFNLTRGWNLIGNPYQYPVPLSQLIAVAEDNSRESLTWADLVKLGYVSPSLAFWERNPDDPTTGSYKYTAGSTDLIQPHRGYWLYVATFRPIRLAWPAIYLEELPNSGRSEEERWEQTPREWRLQLVARNIDSMDSQNFIGVATAAGRANELRMPKPPKAPATNLEVAVLDQMGGQPMRMARAFADRMSRKEWTVEVHADRAGEFTLTWPNVSSVPRNVRFRLTDVATGATRDLRMSSGYTVRMDAPGIRQFKLVMEPGGPSRAVIGNVVVNRVPTREGTSPFTISYTLSGDATTTVRILSATGREVFTVTRGRADAAGETSVVWALRDNANRAVAPGSYRVEILAETANGERVRRIVPINVTR